MLRPACHINGRTQEKSNDSYAAEMVFQPAPTIKETYKCALKLHNSHRCLLIELGLVLTDNKNRKMSQQGTTDINVDEENKTIRLSRVFAAPVPLVWKAFTDSAILDQWWAPKPWKAQTKSMNFSDGGAWEYAMAGPDGEKHWSMVRYSVIRPQAIFSGLDAFTDENGNIKADMPQTNWNVSFESLGDSTLVRIVMTADDFADLEKLIEMGFKEGITSAMNNLDELLPSLEK